MATGILGLGSSGASSLNEELITKLKEAERKAKIEPIETRINNITSVEEGEEGESYKIEEIKSKISAFIETTELFDLYNTDSNVFSEITADTTGTSVAFSVDNPSILDEGITTVVVNVLAQKDVYQSDTFSDSSVQIDGGNDAGDKISISIGGATALEFSTEGKTYAELATEINDTDGLSASIEQVGDSSYRLVIKSESSGTANALTITQSGVELGLNTLDNHTLQAQNLEATIDGISYNISSNQIITQGGLKVNAIAIGTSTITISKSTSSIIPAIDKFVSGYNDIIKTINSELTNAESKIEDTSTLKALLDMMKEILYDDYGATTPTYGTEVDEYGDVVYKHSNVTNNDKNIFNYGFSINDSTYELEVDDTVFSDAITNNLDELEALFVGVANNEGLGTIMKEYLNEQLNFSTGLLYQYDTNLASRLSKLEEEKEEAQATLDAKYQLLAEQFASYTAIITQMEASFGGLKMMIEQSTASK